VTISLLPIGCDWGRKVPDKTAVAELCGSVPATGCSHRAAICRL